MITTIIFDFSGVVLDMKKLRDSTKELFNTDDEESFWIDINIYSNPLCRDEITLTQFWNRISEKYGIEPNLELLNRLWINDYEALTTINDDVINIISELKLKYKVALVSNTIRQHADINRKLGRYDCFDYVFLSNELHMTKDQKEFFHFILEKMDVNAENCILIDDIQKFLDIAKQTGVSTILFKDALKLREDLSKEKVDFLYNNQGKKEDNGFIMQEYIDISNNLRHYGTLQFAHLTLYTAVMGGLIHLLTSGNANIQPQIVLILKIIGYILSVLFFIIAERIILDWQTFLDCARVMEKKHFGFGQYSIRPNYVIFFFRNRFAVRWIHVFIILFWTVSIILDIP